MPSRRGVSEVWSLLTLRGTRARLTGLRYRLLVGLIAIGYAVGAMIFGGMLYLPSRPLRLGTFFYIYPSGPGPHWMYPAILAGSPYFQLDLPIVSAILMTLSAAGVGLGMALAVYLGVRLVRQRRAGAVGPLAMGTAAGLTPAMIALVTLGACCSTTVAATAGISLAAQSSGTNAATLLANTWYLGLFQVVVVYVALVAQEQLVKVYGLLLGGSPETEPPHGTAAPPSSTPGGIGSAAVRVALVAAGLTWSLSMFARWITTPPGSAGAPAWFGWIVQHQLPGLLAVLVALFPGGARELWRRLSRSGSALAIRGALIVSGLALLTWLPPAVSRRGAPALGNELLGFWRYPASWGAVHPPALGPYGLLFRWAFQFGLLGLFALSMGISPEVTLRPFLRRSARARWAPADPSPLEPGPTVAPPPLRVRRYGPDPKGRATPEGSGPRT
ncbi:MAG: hypothetical protein ACLQD8_07460 [Thermoplasmata archaeon]